MVRTYRSFVRRAGLLLGLWGLCACKTEDPPPQVVLGPDEVPVKVARRCPGDDGCRDEGDGALAVGVAKRDLSPTINDQSPLWLAGFGTGRKATGVHDAPWARALALSQNQTTVVLVAVDTLGLFRDETLEIEKLLDKDVRDRVDLLLISATHCHETPDLVGAWGENPFKWGVNEAYREQVRRGIAAAAMEAVRGARPARATFGSIPVQDADGSMTAYVGDARDPVVIDNTLRVISFREPGAPKPLATLINWAHHPESVGDKNQLVSSDFVHYLRETVEQRHGGTVVYVSGALGGQIGPGRVTARDAMGMPVREYGFPKAEAIGTSVAQFALQALADPNARSEAAPRLAFRSAVVPVHIENTRFHLASDARIYRRSLCCYDPQSPIDANNLPQTETALAYLTLGPASIITNPGELHPELFIGGYDGKAAGTYRFLDTTKPNAADLSKAPGPPYLIDLMDGERRFRMTFGLTGDFLGYIVPRFNFVLHPGMPYFEEADGDHYEETNSVGPRAEPEIVGSMRQLVLDRAAPR